MGEKKEKKLILVTGGAGFIGTHLCTQLIKDGHTVISLDNYFTGSKENHIAGVDYREGHTKDIEKHVPETPDIIYHLGEYSRTAVAMDEPDVVWDLNVHGTFGVLEFWRKRGGKLVYAGSSTKFSQRLEATEVIEGRNLSPYMWTKAANTELVSNYGRWYNLPFAIAYFYNVYGPGELAGKYGTVIEIFKQRYLKGEPLQVNSPGTQTRNYTHVEDIVSGLLLVGEKGQGDEYGIGATRAYSTREVAELFGTEIIMMPSRKTSRTFSSVDPVRMQSLGWSETRTLEEYIESIKKEKEAK